MSAVMTHKGCFYCFPVDRVILISAHPQRAYSRFGREGFVELSYAVGGSSMSSSSQEGTAVSRMAGNGFVVEHDVRTVTNNGNKNILV